MSSQPSTKPLNETLKSYWDITTTQTGHYTTHLKHPRASSYRCTHAKTYTRAHTRTITAQWHPLPTEYPFLFNGNLGRPAQHLTVTSLRKMFLICLCHLIIHILPRLCRTILQDINSQLNPGLYHLWGQSSRSPRRSRDFLLTVVVI